MPRVIELFKNNKINLKDLISHELELSDFNEALKIVDSGNFSKIIFKC
jgi:Zn-dependent alcohol dehydrogenase